MRCTLPLLSLGMVVWLPTLGEAASRIEFNRDIRPILSNNCFECHGPDNEHRKAKLRLDTREGALKSGVIVPGKASESELFLRVTHEEPARRMPPKKFRKQLTTNQVELLRQWIDEGAEYQSHWAFLPPSKRPLPSVQNGSWVRNPIDRFVLTRLEREGVPPSKEADRRTLIRRVTFDLTGLPPTPAEVESFVNDTSSDAYEKVVDRLLASAHYGEHMTRYWLDATRFGDTHGLHLDNYRQIWPYRDWVVRAYNRNLPFDRFTLEQLAGDLLPNPTDDQMVASGYNRNHVTTNEGGSIVEEVYVRNVVDRTSTTSTVWMGLTAGCAVCHDHKFDPITQKEFYQLFAFFNSMDGSAMDGNKPNPTPVLKVPTLDQESRLAELEKDIASLEQRMKFQLEDTNPEYERWLVEVSAKQSEKPRDVVNGLVARFALDETDGTQTENSINPKQHGKVVGPPAWSPGKIGNAFPSDGSRYVDLGKVGDFERDRGFSYGAWVRWNGGRGGSAPLSRMNDGNGYRGYDIYLVNGQIAAHIIHRWQSDALKVTTKSAIKPNTWHHLFVTYDGSSKAAGIRVYIDGKVQPVVVNADNLKNTIRCSTGLRVGRRNPSSIFSGLVDEVRLYDRELAPEEVQVLAGADPIGPILSLPSEKRSTLQKQTLKRFYLTQFNPEYVKTKSEVAGLRSEQSKLATKMPTTLVMKETASPRDAFLLMRGAYDKRGDKVQRATPSFLPPMKKEAPRNRLGLAQWLLQPEHPLTSRVAVNRYWQMLFGTESSKPRRISVPKENGRLTPNCSTGLPCSSSRMAGMSSGLCGAWFSRRLIDNPRK